MKKKRKPLGHSKKKERGINPENVARMRKHPSFLGLDREWETSKAIKKGEMINSVLKDCQVSIRSLARHLGKHERGLRRYLQLFQQQRSPEQRELSATPSARQTEGLQESQCLQKERQKGTPPPSSQEQTKLTTVFAGSPEPCLLESDSQNVEDDRTAIELIIDYCADELILRMREEPISSGFRSELLLRLQQQLSGTTNENCSSPLPEQLRPWLLDIAGDSKLAKSACERARDYFHNPYNWEPPPSWKHPPPAPEVWELRPGLGKQFVINIKWILSDVELIRLILKDMQKSIESRVPFPDLHHIPRRVRDFYRREGLDPSPQETLVEWLKSIAGSTTQALSAITIAINHFSAVDLHYNFRRPLEQRKAHLSELKQDIQKQNASKLVPGGLRTRRGT